MGVAGTLELGSTEGIMEGRIVVDGISVGEIVSVVREGRLISFKDGALLGSEVGIIVGSIDGKVVVG